MSHDDDSCDSSSTDMSIDGKASSQASLHAVKSTLYKTELCHTWMETGRCRYGKACQFAHGEHELRSKNRHAKYKTQMCKFYHAGEGFCTYGSRCCFTHELTPLFHDEHVLKQPGLGLDLSSSSEDASPQAHDSSMQKNVSRLPVFAQLCVNVPADPNAADLHAENFDLASLNESFRKMLSFGDVQY
jgi:hypothetical protein